MNDRLATLTVAVIGCLFVLPAAAGAQKNQAARMDLRVTLLPASGACSAGIKSGVDATATIDAKGEFHVKEFPQLSMKCDKLGTKVTITVDGGLHYDRANKVRRMIGQVHGKDAFIRYALVTPAGGYWGDAGYAGTTASSETPYIYEVNLLNNRLPVRFLAFAKGQPGTYTDTVTFTLNY